MKRLLVWSLLVAWWCGSVAGCKSLVLVAGGQDQNGNILASAEIFDPETFTFSTTGNMSQPRLSATATLFLNDTVLVAGGTSGLDTDTSSADLFDPFSGTFSPTGSMNAQRSAYTATLFQSGALTGEVLMVGGGPFPPVPTAELYNPATGSFTLTGNPVHPRCCHTATLLPSGSVLIAGGIDGSGTVLNIAELYNPVTGTFSATGSMTAARKGHTATLLTTGPLAGQVLIVGGAAPETFAPLASAELYDPITGVFTSTGSLSVARQLHTATLLNDGRALVAGGYSFNSEEMLGYTTDTTEIYDPMTATFTMGPTMTTPRYLHTATLLTRGSLAGWVLMAGGDNSFAFSDEILASAELYNPASNVFTATGPMNQARFLHVASEILEVNAPPTPTTTPARTPLPTPMPGM